MIVSSCEHCDERQFQTLSCVMCCTLHDFLCSKVKFIHTCTHTRSHSCSGKNTRTFRVHLVLGGFSYADDITLLRPSLAGVEAHMFCL